MRPGPVTLVPQAMLALAASTGLVLLHQFALVDLKHYLGGVPPMVVAISLPAVAVASLWILQARAGLSFLCEGGAGRGLAFAALLATLFAVPPIVFDLIWGLASGVQIGLTVALAFYPVMAFVAETVFHLFSLSVLVALTGIRHWRGNSALSLWLLLIPVAFIEPAFQTWMRLPVEAPMLATGFVAIHVFAFNLAQLWVFVRFGFVAMLAMRMVYYFWWHIVWAG